MTEYIINNKNSINVFPQILIGLNLTKVALSVIAPITKIFFSYNCYHLRRQMFLLSFKLINNLFFVYNLLVLMTLIISDQTS